MTNHNLICEIDGGVLKSGVLYEINHAYLPPDAPDKLRATHVVLMTWRNITYKTIGVRYTTDAHSLRAFISTSIAADADPDVFVDEYPRLKEVYSISNDVAQKLLFREISEEEYKERKHSVDFWLVGDTADSNVVRGTRRSKHTWTNDEDAKLIDALMELHASGKYADADNGFKPGYLNGVQQLLDVSLPNSGLKAEPHIKSRMNTWKTHFSIVDDMVHTSGFGWDEEKTCVVAENSVWDEYVKSHKGAANFRGNPFLFYDKLCTIFGKDRATGSKAIDLGEEDDDIPETQRSSPIDDFDFVEQPVQGRSEAPTSSVTSKRKRHKSMDGDEIYWESYKEMKEVLVRFGEIVGENLNKESLEAREIYEKVSDKLKALPGITMTKRFKAAHLIGKDVVLGRSFLGLTQEEKIGMVESYTDCSMG